jgi:hypothetical protein
MLSEALAINLWYWQQRAAEEESPLQRSMQCWGHVARLETAAQLSTRAPRKDVSGVPNQVAESMENRKG